MLLTHAEVQSALACPVVVAGRADVPRVCQHVKIKRYKKPGDDRAVVRCECGTFWTEYPLTPTRTRGNP